MHRPWTCGVRCGQLLVRLLRTPAGLLAVARQHNPPTRAQLQAKAAGQWHGGGQQDAHVVKDDRGTRIANPLATQVGWWDAAAWVDEDGPDVPLGVHVLQARCACGRRLGGQPGEVLALLRSGVAARLRSVEAPEHLLRVS